MNYTKSFFLVMGLSFGVLLVIGGFLALKSGAAHHRALVSAVTQQLDGHSNQISTLLGTMRGSNVTLVADAAFQELQGIPSTSLIERSMVNVVTSTNGQLECVIDTSSFGVPPRTIRSSQ